jgi:hypothetical protein
VSELPEDAIAWTLAEAPRRIQPIDLLAMTDAEVLATARNALDDRDAYRLLALEALTALHLITAERDRLRQRVRDLSSQLRKLLCVEVAA